MPDHYSLLIWYCTLYLPVAWDTYMEDFEQKSQDYVKDMDESHQGQLASLKKSVSESIDTKPMKRSRDLIQYRKRQQLMAEQRRYEEARMCQLTGDILEEKERSNRNSNVNTSLQKRGANMKTQQKAEINVLTKRIESKRKEYTKQRDTLIMRLLQRNTIIQATFDSKHVSCCVET